MDICEYIKTEGTDKVPSFIRELANVYVATNGPKAAIKQLNEQAKKLEYILEEISKNGKCDCKM